MGFKMDLRIFLLIAISAILSHFVWRFLKFKRFSRDLPNLLAQGAVIIDVRTPDEFRRGNRSGSVNIPLDTIKSRAHELDKNKTFILCCASGTRSAVAAGILKRKGFGGVVNAGPWTNTLVETSKRGTVR